MVFIFPSNSRKESVPKILKHVRENEQKLCFHLKLSHNGYNNYFEFSKKVSDVWRAVSDMDRVVLDFIVEPSYMKPLL